MKARIGCRRRAPCRPAIEFEVRGPAGGDFEFSVGFAATPAPAEPRGPGAAAGGLLVPFARSAAGSTSGTSASRSSLDCRRRPRCSRRFATRRCCSTPADIDGFVVRAARQDAASAAVQPRDRLLVVAGAGPRGLARPATGTPPPLGGSGNVGPPVFAADDPRRPRLRPGHGARGRRCASARGPADAPPAQMTQSTLEVDTVVQRPDRAGLRPDRPARHRARRRHRQAARRNATCGSSTCTLGAKFPRGIAVNVETAIVAGGGSILHDPDQGIYFGILDLAFRGGITMQAICLVATRNPDGSKGFSLHRDPDDRAGQPLSARHGLLPAGRSAGCSPCTAPSTRRRCGRRCRPGSCATCSSRPTRCTTRRRSCTRSRRCSRYAAAATCSGVLVEDRLGLADPGAVRAGRHLRVGQPAPADHPRPGQRDPAAHRPRRSSSSTWTRSASSTSTPAPSPSTRCCTTPGSAAGS